MLSQKVSLSGFIITFHTYCSYPDLKLFSIRVVRGLKYSPGKQSLLLSKKKKKITLSVFQKVYGNLHVKPIKTKQ